MDTNFLSFFLYFAVSVVGVWCQTCEEAHYKRCLKQLLKFTDRGDLMFASSASELQTECVQAQSALGCLTRYSRKCLPLEERSTFNDEISGQQQITTGLCTEENDLRARYIRNLPCIRNISEGLQYCREKYERNQRDIILVEYEDKLHLKCCSFEGYRRCLKILTMTQEGCSLDDTAPDVIDEIAVRMGGALAADACAEHADRCTGSGAYRTASYVGMMQLLWILGTVLFVRRW